MNYVLDEKGEPIPCPDILEWGRWFEDPDKRIVKKDAVGKVSLSTVFLGIDHNFGPKGPPLLWETMIFGGKHDQEQWRYTSRAEAMGNHEKLLSMLKREAADWS